jgi:hypothetical protein
MADQHAITMHYMHLHNLAIANCFNTFFTTVGVRLKNSFSHKYPKNSRVVNLSSASEFQFKDITVDFVRKELSSLKMKKSSGLKDIHTRLLKLGADVLASPLTYIFNISLRTTIIPRTWKYATVTPLHKSGSKLDHNNYRPISVLPVHGDENI